MNVGIFIYDNAEVLDFSGPFEMFSTASRLSNPQNAFNVFLVAEHKRPVMARGGYGINPHFTFDNHPPMDLLIVVGGAHTEAVKNPKVIEWVAEVAPQTPHVASVCTGAFILAEAGQISGLRVTTHWEDLADLQASYPDLTVLAEQRWVEDGKFVTSAGISAGIDMSLYLVSKLVDLTLAEATAKQMEYDWQKRAL
ncbi:DJ-1/PfpI family protein [Microbulbifer agarilyticus]